MLAGMAAKWRWKARRKAPRQADRQAEPGVRPGAGLLGQVLRLLGDREARGPHAPRGLSHGRREHAGRGRREHHRRRSDAWGHLHGPVRVRRSRWPRPSTPLQERTGLDVDIHVDGASGAFLAPFTAPEMVWDFRLPRVKSISTSGHKYGLAPVGVGWALWRDVAVCQSELVFSVPYLGGSVGTFGINFSRPAGQVIAQYYNFLRLGRSGYRRVHEACSTTRRAGSPAQSPSWGRSSSSATAIRPTASQQ